MTRAQIWVLAIIVFGVIGALGGFGWWDWAGRYEAGWLSCAFIALGLTKLP